MGNREIMHRSLEVFGAEAQILKAVEECGELIIALTKCLNRIPSNHLEEMADVEIMLEQLKMIFGVSQEEIDKIKDFKLQRLLNRINEIKSLNDKN